MNFDESSVLSYISTSLSVMYSVLLPKSMKYDITHNYFLFFNQMELFFVRTYKLNIYCQYGHTSFNLKKMEIYFSEHICEYMIHRKSLIIILA